MGYRHNHLFMLVYVWFKRLFPGTYNMGITASLNVLTKKAYYILNQGRGKIGTTQVRPQPQHFVYAV